MHMRKISGVELCRDQSGVLEPTIGIMSLFAQQVKYIDLPPFEHQTPKKTGLRSFKWTISEGV